MPARPWGRPGIGLPRQGVQREEWAVGRMEWWPHPARGAAKLDEQGRITGFPGTKNVRLGIPSLYSPTTLSLKQELKTWPSLFPML